MKERAARLLSGRNEPSVLERESLARSVIDDAVGQPDKRRHHLWIRLAAAGAVGAAVVTLLVTPLPRDLAPRSGSAGTTFETICRPGPDCAVGGQLVFRVSNAPQGFEHVAIFAQREDGLVIWYFPTDEREMSATFRDSEWMDEGVALVGAHAPGLYVIHALVSREPVTRASARALVERGGDESHELLRTQVTLHP
ncbi:MAG: hypothetical protein AAGF92_01955 [Myxococcota bacterium]